MSRKRSGLLRTLWRWIVGAKPVEAQVAAKTSESKSAEIVQLVGESVSRTAGAALQSKLGTAVAAGVETAVAEQPAGGEAGGAIVVLSQHRPVRRFLAQRIGSSQALNHPKERAPRRQTRTSAMKALPKRATGDAARTLKPRPSVKPPRVLAPTRVTAEVVDFSLKRTAAAGRQRKAA